MGCGWKGVKFPCSPSDFELSFEFPEYTYLEADITINEAGETGYPPIYIVRERGVVPQEAVSFKITAVPAGLSTASDATYDEDYSIGITQTQTYSLNPDEERVLFPFGLFDDSILEGNEAFKLELSNDDSGPQFVTGSNPFTIVTIVDND